MTIRDRAGRGSRRGPGPQPVAVRGRNDGPAHALHAAGVLRLQRSAGNAATATLLAGRVAEAAPAVQRQPAADPVERAGRALRDLEAWADDETKRQNVVDRAAVVGLDPKQAASVRAAAGALAGHVPVLRKAATVVDPALASLAAATAAANEAATLLRSRDAVDHLSADGSRNRSKDAVTRAVAQLATVKGIDTKTLLKNLRAIEASLAGGGSPADAAKFLSRSTADLRAVRDTALARADGARRVAVVLRAFLAVNDPAFASPPTAAEIADVRSRLSGGLGDEFAAVFGSSVDYDFFVEFTNTWGQQVEARDAMAAATKRPAPAVPDRADAHSYFTALAGKGDDVVFPAYEGFASAFFVHRGIASAGDLRLTVPALFAARASITGRRGLVCTGYASMGAEVLALAGARFDGFSIGVHADDDMVREDRFDEQGHAVARMTRGGTAFCVSNDTIVRTKNALVGPGAIAWGDRSKPLFVGEGPTTDAAVTVLLDKLAAQKRALARRGRR